MSFKTQFIFSEHKWEEIFFITEIFNIYIRVFHFLVVCPTWSTYFQVLLIFLAWQKIVVSKLRITYFQVLLIFLAWQKILCIKVSYQTRLSSMKKKSCNFFFLNQFFLPRSLKQLTLNSESLQKRQGSWSINLVSLARSKKKTKTRNFLRVNWDKASS